MLSGFELYPRWVPLVTGALFFSSARLAPVMQAIRFQAYDFRIRHSY